jgi:hypothetical protein
MAESSCWFQEMQQYLRTRNLYHFLPEILGRLSSSYLHPLPGVNEVTVESWQLVTAIHCEGDGLILYE